MTASAAGPLPVVVGVGQLANNRDRTPDAAREPADLILEAVAQAAADAGPGEALLRAVDDIDVVDVMSWAYHDLPALIAERIGATPHRAAMSDVGGNRPVEVVDRAAARIAAGESRVVLVCGGEAVASMTTLAKLGVDPGWSRDPGGPVAPRAAEFGSERMGRYGILLPIRVYPLYENALRADLGQTFAESQRASAEMYAQFSRVAAANDAAWDPVERTPEEIGDDGPGNRMVCWPYPLLMNARIHVDQAAAVILCEAETARELGVGSGMVHVWGGAASEDCPELLERVSYSRAPGMEAALGTTLAQAGVGAGDLDVVDLYSCFPVMPKLAARFLGLSPDTQLSATGGLTAFGGPVSNYSLHSVVAVTRRLRAGARLALVYGNGGFVTKHHGLLLGASPHADGYVGADGAVAPTAADGPPITDAPAGEAHLETYTVEFDRDGAPALGYVIGRLTDGSRFYAHADDPATLAALTDRDREPIGRAGTVSTSDGELSRFTVA